MTTLAKLLAESPLSDATKGLAAKVLIDRLDDALHQLPLETLEVQSGMVRHDVAYVRVKCAHQGLAHEYRLRLYPPTRRGPNPTGEKVAEWSLRFEHRGFKKSFGNVPGKSFSPQRFVRWFHGWLVDKHDEHAADAAFDKRHAAIDDLYEGLPERVGILATPKGYEVRVRCTEEQLPKLLDFIKGEMP